MGKTCLGHHEGACEIQCHDSFPMGKLHLSDFFAGNQATGVVDQNIYTAKISHSLCNQCVHIFLLIQITLQGKSVSTRGFDRRNGIIGGGGTGKVVYCNIRAFRRQLLGHGGADIATRPCNNGRFPCEFHVVPSFVQSWANCPMNFMCWPAFS